MGGVQQHRLAHGWIGRIEHTLTHGWIGWTHTHMDRLDGWAPTHKVGFDGWTLSRIWMDGWNDMPTHTWMD